MGGGPVTAEVPVTQQPLKKDPLSAPGSSGEKGGPGRLPTDPLHPPSQTDLSPRVRSGVASGWPHLSIARSLG